MFYFVIFSSLKNATYTIFVLLMHGGHFIILSMPNLNRVRLRSYWNKSTNTFFLFSDLSYC